jgi:hypothetical protein
VNALGLWDTAIAVAKYAEGSGMSRILTCAAVPWIIIAGCADAGDLGLSGLSHLLLKLRMVSLLQSY